MKRGLALAVGFAMALTAVAAMAQTRQLAITTGGTGGVYHPLGAGLANIIAKHIPDTTAASEVTGGAAANLQLVGSGRADMGLTQVDVAADAVHGVDRFKSGKLPIQAIAVMYLNHMHLVTLEGSGITKIEDLKGRRVSVGAPGSATEVLAFRVMAAAGLDRDKDLKRERLGVAESANAIKDKKIDAFFWAGGLPTAALADLGTTPGIKLKLIDTAQHAEKMAAKYGGIYAAAVIPQATYGLDADNKSVGVWNIMMVNESMDEELAYRLTKLLFEKREELGLVHKAALDLKPENQTKVNAGIPFHRGAVRYFAEKGIKVD